MTYRNPMMLEGMIKTPPFTPYANWTSKYIAPGSAPADAAAVTNWYDTVSQYIATQSTANFKPAYVADAGDGFPAVAFDNTTYGKRMDIASALGS